MRSKSWIWKQFGGSFTCSLFFATAFAAPTSALFTVADGIEMLLPTDDQRGAGDGYNCSPDGQYCLVSLVKGNLKAGVNEHTLLLYQTTDLRAFVNSPRAAALPEGKEIARFSTDGAESGIDQVVWTAAGDRIRFIGRGLGENASGQVFEIDAKSLTVRQLTKSSYPIVKFAASETANAIIYAAKVRASLDEKKKYGYVVTHETFSDMVLADAATTASQLHFFVTRDQNAADVRLPIEEPSTYPSGLAISPSGRWAIITRSPRAIPSAWLAYDYIRRFYDSIDPVQSREATNGLVSELDRYGGWFGAIYVMDLVDLNDLSIRPLVDAPATRGAGIWWSPDESRVMLTDTHVPLQNCSASASTTCSDLLSAVVPLLAGPTGPALVPLPVPRGVRSKVRSVEWNNVGSIVAHQEVRRGSTYEDLLLTFRSVDDRYELVRRDQAKREAARIRLWTREGPNTPPEIWASDGRTDRSRRISDLNPQLKRITLGRVSDFSWRSDQLGQTIEGGLFLPPNYEEGRKYPAVLQIYGFAKELFEAGGPSTTAFAARPLANIGMVVLQFGCPAFGPWTGDFRTGSENGRARTCIESAIDALDSAGLIDRGKVGLVAFSHTGLYVMHTITFSDYPIAAAVIADSIANTPFAYALQYGMARPGMLTWDTPMETAPSMMGSPLFGDGVRNWTSESPIFHLHRVRSAVRFEQIDAYPAYWDIYAVMKRMKRPTEMISYPGEMHSLQTPQARFNSQQGSVDWFRFWLKGEERTAADTKEQYERWRALRNN